MGRFNFPMLILIILLSIIIAVPVIIYTNFSIWLIIPLSPVVVFIGLVFFSWTLELFEPDEQKTANSSLQHGYAPIFLRTRKPDGLLCPSCNSDKIMEIVYGLPAITEEVKKEIEKKTITLGGCMVSKDSPQWMCGLCDCKFDSPPINKKQAFQIVQEIIKSFDAPEDDEYIIIEPDTIEKEWGWVFFHDSRKWVQTKDFKYAVAGNAPFIVLRKNGKVLDTGTAYEIDHYIKRFEETGDPNG